jgi:hypothetical protein
MRKCFSALRQYGMDYFSGHCHTISQVPATATKMESGNPSRQ